jgi:putative addiction module component (TIGR02574 family)
MTNPVPLPPPGFDALSVDEQIEYVQSLWDRIAATPKQVPVPEWHREILDERLRDYEADPEAGESWDVVRERLHDKLRQR